MLVERGFHNDEKLRYIINVRPPRELEVEILDGTCVYVLSEVSQPHPLMSVRYVSSRLRRTVWIAITIDGSVEWSQESDIVLCSVDSSRDVCGSLFLSLTPLPGGDVQLSVYSIQFLRRRPLFLLCELVKFNADMNRGECG